MTGRHVYAGRRDHEFDAPVNGHHQVDGVRYLLLSAWRLLLLL